MEWVDVDRIYVVQDRDRWQAVVDTAFNVGNFLD
jgi:hypothetical protein